MTTEPKPQTSTEKLEALEKAIVAHNVNRRKCQTTLLLARAERQKAETYLVLANNALIEVLQCIEALEGMKAVEDLRAEAKDITRPPASEGIDLDEPDMEEKSGQDLAGF